MPLFVELDGHHLTHVHLHVPNRGVWWADCDIDQAAALKGRTTLTIGSIAAKGTVAPEFSGSFLLASKIRIVGGAGAWGSQLVRKAYHADNGVKTKTIADDAAREAGETLGTFLPPVERVGADWVREAGTASQTLENLLDGVAWWVGLDGVTNAGPRPATEAKAGTYELLSYDPRTRVATLTADDPASIGIGSILRDDRLDGPQTVREIEIVIDGDSLRILAWCGGDERTDGRLVRALRSIIQRATGGKLPGKWRYRVYQMAGDRVNLQAVSKAVGLPDVLPVSMAPGVAGVWAELKPGAIVYVEFADGGDPSLPVVTGFSPKEDGGFVPVSIIIGQESSALAAARRGDLTSSGGVGTMCTLMPLTGAGLPPNNAIGAGIPCLISFDAIPPTPAHAAPLFGSVMTGSDLVQIGNK